MIGNVNLGAYSGIEKLANYSPESLLAYRRGRLDRYQSHVGFIRARSSGRGAVDALEIGSGSSALLYALAQAGVLREGMGVELSTSRHEFAERWKADNGFSMVQNIRANFTDVEMGTNCWDWFIVIDNTFTYLYPEDPTYPARLLGAAQCALRADGRVLLDFINYANRTPGVDYKQWLAFPLGDPFSYGLYSNCVAIGVNDSLSIFIKRDGTEERKVEKSKVYPIAELTALLGDAGFSLEAVFADFRGTPYDEQESERLVVVAQKAPTALPR